MKVLVTGASGFMGSHLVDLLVDRGYEIRVTSRRRPAYLSHEKFRSVEFVPSDLTKSWTLGPTLSGVERIYHVGALFKLFAQREVLLETNAVATDRLCSLARDAGVREFVTFSSGAIYGGGYGNRLAEETDPPRPGDPYSMSKWEGERRAFIHNGKNGFRVMSLRPGGVYGPGSVYGDAQALYLMRRGILAVVPGLGEFVSAHIHVRDCMAAAVFLSERSESWDERATTESEVAYNLCDDTPLTSRRLLRLACDLMPRKGLFGFLGIPVPAAPLLILAALCEVWAGLFGGDPLFDRVGIRFLTTGHGMTNAKLRAAGYRFLYPETATGLKETIDWNERNGWRGFRGGEPALSVPWTGVLTA